MNILRRVVKATIFVQPGTVREPYRNIEWRRGVSEAENRKGGTVMKRKVEGTEKKEKPPAKIVDWFFENACPDHHVRGGPAHAMARHTAMRILERYPEISSYSFHTSVVSGELQEVERVLAERPRAASEKSSATAPDRSDVGGAGDLFRDIGPKGWEPLLFLCFTRLPLAAANDNAPAIARALLDNGADPNAYFMAGSSRYTPLVGAIGEGEEDRPPHPRRDALVQLLLERGAEPYDIQVIYNIGFHGNVLWFLEAIYAQCVKLGRQADWNDPNWSMLDMGGYGSGARWHLDIAVKNNNLELAEWVLQHGASPNAPPGREKRRSQRTLYEEAMLRGQTELADLLVRYGATPIAVVLDDEAKFAAACFRSDRRAAQELIALHPEFLGSTRTIFSATEQDRADVVELLLDLGMSPDVEDGRKQRPLHIAGYNDSITVAALLIERGAEIDPVESNWGNTPLDCAVHSQNFRMIEILGRHSRDVWNLTFTGNVERLREVLNDQPELAKVRSQNYGTPLMWLPDDESRAMAVVELFLANGADPTIRNIEGHTAADRADKRGLFDVAKALRSAS
jgi:ankyrin repeat protein